MMIGAGTLPSHGLPRGRLLGWTTGLARAEPSSNTTRASRHLTDGRWGIAIDTPPGWSVSQRTGYVQTVFLLQFPDGSRISLSAEKTAARSASELLEPNRLALVKQGFAAVSTAAGPGDWRTLDFDIPNASRKPDKDEHPDPLDKARQLYLLRPGSNPATATSVVLTLTAPARSFAARLPDLAYVAERVAFDAPASPRLP